MGDGWLVEFASVVDAVICAIQIQEQLTGNEVTKLRIGVHLGDIMHQDEDIFGDGVNIAARLQEIAKPGAILSQTSPGAASMANCPPPLPNWVGKT